LDIIILLKDVACQVIRRIYYLPSINNRHFIYNFSKVMKGAFHLMTQSFYLCYSFHQEGQNDVCVDSYH